MQFKSELLPGVWHISLKSFKDARGVFIKTFQKTVYSEYGIDENWVEEFYSVSSKDVIRGMHFQKPPSHHAKLVYCAHGSVLDVMLDLRSGPGYGRVADVRLESDAPSVLLMPPGIAHGFRSLVDDSLMVYKTSTEYDPNADSGIRWDTFGYDWNVVEPLISDRDSRHPSFSDFLTEF